MAKKQKKTADKTSTVKKPKGQLAKTPKSIGGDIVLTTLALGAAGVLGYLGWQYVKKRKAGNGPNLDETLLRSQTTPATNSTPVPGTPVMETLSPLPGNITTPPFMPSDTASYSSGSTTKTKGSRSSNNSSTPAAGDDFPLKRGSKGDNVRALQQAIIKKYGRQILPRYGADGGFGSETVAALKKLKLPATISETMFNVLTQGNNSATTSDSNITDLSSLAGNIYQAIIRRDFATVLSLLGKIRSSDDYSTVSEHFKQYRINGVRQTLVNGLLNVFSSDAQKQQLRLAFAQMGLQYDGSKWSLAGIDGIPIITITPAKIWVTPTISVTVPARMVLGNEVARKLQYVLFGNRGRYFLVHSNCIQRL